MTFQHTDWQFWKKDGKRTWSIFIWHSSWKVKGDEKFCISLWSLWHQIEDSLLVLEIGSYEHTTNDLPTFSPQKQNLEIRPSERLLPIFGTKNRILKIGSCERAFWQKDGRSKFHFAKPSEDIIAYSSLPPSVASLWWAVQRIKTRPPRGSSSFSWLSISKHRRWWAEISTRL